jgi:hypothetical protein
MNLSKISSITLLLLVILLYEIISGDLLTFLSQMTSALSWRWWRSSYGQKIGSSRHIQVTETFPIRPCGISSKGDMVDCSCMHRWMTYFYSTARHGLCWRRSFIEACEKIGLLLRIVLGRAYIVLSRYSVWIDLTLPCKSLISLVFVHCAYVAIGSRALISVRLLPISLCYQFDSKIHAFSSRSCHKQHLSPTDRYLPYPFCLLPLVHLLNITPRSKSK